MPTRRVALEGARRCVVTDMCGRRLVRRWVASAEWRSPCERARSQHTIGWFGLASRQHRMDRRAWYTRREIGHRRDRIPILAGLCILARCPMQGRVQGYVIRRFNGTLDATRGERRSFARCRRDGCRRLQCFGRVRHAVQNTRQWIDEWCEHGDKAEQQPRKGPTGHARSIVS